MVFILLCSFLDIATERWKLCHAIASSSFSSSQIKQPALLSFDSGLQPRPLDVYFQNLFCNILNVTVLYPFHSTAFQQALWGSSSVYGDNSDFPVRYVAINNNIIE